MEMRRRRGRKTEHKRNRRPGQIAAAACLLVVCVLFAGAYAKYVHNWVSKGGQVRAENFYFTTSLTGDTTMLPQNDDTVNFNADSTSGNWHLYGGTAHDLSIDVQNFYDELRFTDKEIEYTATLAAAVDGKTVENHATLSLGTTAGATTVTGTLAGGEANHNTLTLNVPAYNGWAYADDTIVTLTIRSTAPYTKTFTLNFHLHPTDTSLRYRVEDTSGSPYTQLIIMSNVMTADGKEAYVQPYIIWPDTLDIDNTNNLTFRTENGSRFVQQDGMVTRDMQISQAFATGRSEAIVFFKQDPNANYTRQDTVVVPETDGSRKGQYVIDLTKGSN